MGWVSYLVVGAVLYFIVKRFLKFVKDTFFTVPPVPQLQSTWWGSGPEGQEDGTIQPFTISIKDEVLKDLKNRLDNARSFTAPLEGIQHQYGINTKLLTEIVDYWKTKYNWREREKFLNQYPQFTVSVQGLRIHYIHVKPKNTEGLKVLPLLLLHGWPGSVREFYDIIPLLTTRRSNRTFVFEVIAPSLPGYGFSEGTAKPGLAATQAAVLFNNFMKKVGYEKYYVQGGDWGAIITQFMSALYPDRVLGLHTNMVTVFTLMSNLKTFIGSFYPPLVISKEKAHKMYPFSKRLSYLILESGYFHLQATKPDTVGVGLNDSPVGLAAYILEKFITWTNPSYKEIADGALREKFGYDALLDNVMIYWITNSITTSMRLYAETFSAEHLKLGLDKVPITVPTSIARFSQDITMYQPDNILQERFKNIVHSSDPEGGHFAAFEVPQVLADDIFEGFDKTLKA